MSLAAELAVMGAGVFAGVLVIGGACVPKAALWRALGLMRRR